MISSSQTTPEIFNHKLPGCQRRTSISARSSLAHYNPSALRPPLQLQRELNTSTFRKFWKPGSFVIGAYSEIPLVLTAAERIARGKIGQRARSELRRSAKPISRCRHDSTKTGVALTSRFFYISPFQCRRIHRVSMHTKGERDHEDINHSRGNRISIQ